MLCYESLLIHSGFDLPALKIVFRSLLFHHVAPEEKCFALLILRRFSYISISMARMNMQRQTAEAVVFLCVVSLVLWKMMDLEASFKRWSCFYVLPPRKQLNEEGHL